MPPPVQDRFTRNTFATGIGQLVRLAVVVWLTPILIDGLGLTGYGIWVLLFALVEYTELTTFGIGAAFSRFIADAHGRGDRKEISGILSTGMAFYLAVTAFVLVIWIAGLPVWRGALEYFLGPGFHAAFFMLLVAFLLRNLGTPYRALINGIQRMEFTNIIMIIFQITMAAGTIYVLNRGGSIPELSMVWALCSALNLILLAATGHRLYPALRIAPGRVNIAIFRYLRRFGLRVYAATLAETGNRTSDKLILGIFLGPAGTAAAALYDIGQKIAGLLLMVPAVVSPPIVPAVAADPEPERRNRIVEKGIRLIGAIAVPGSIILAIHSADIVAVWTRIEDIETAGLVTIILLFSTLVFVVANLAAAVARGLGNPSAEMRFSLLKLGLNIALSIILVLQFGLIGVVAGTLAASIIAYGGLFITLQHQYHFSTTGQLIVLLLWPALLAFVASYAGTILFTDAGLGWSHLLPALAVEGVFTLLLLFATGYFKPLFRQTRKGEA